MYLEAKIYNWILRHKWRGHTTIEGVVDSYSPLYKNKYGFNDVEQLKTSKIFIEMRQNSRFELADAYVSIKTDKGIEKFKVLDISEGGLSIMLTTQYTYFNRFHKHRIELSIGNETIKILAQYRHLTLVTCKRTYYKYGLEFLDNKEAVRELFKKHFK